jgi:hypothetical protein
MSGYGWVLQWHQHQSRIRVFAGFAKPSCRLPSVICVTACCHLGCRSYPRKYRSQSARGPRLDGLSQGTHRFVHQLDVIGAR